MKQVEGGNCYISFIPHMGRAVPLAVLWGLGHGGWDGGRASPGQAALAPCDGDSAVAPPNACAHGPWCAGTPEAGEDQGKWGTSLSGQRCSLPASFSPRARQRGSHPAVLAGSHSHHTACLQFPKKHRAGIYRDFRPPSSLWCPWVKQITWDMEQTT